MVYFSYKSQHSLSPLFFTKKENIGKYIHQQSKAVWNEKNPTNRLDYIVIDIMKGEPPKNLVFQDKEEPQEQVNKKTKEKLTTAQELEKLEADILKMEQRLKRKIEKRGLLINTKSINL